MGTRGRIRGLRGLLAKVAFLALAVVLAGGVAGDDGPTVPRIWEGEGFSDFEVPLAVADASPVHIPAELFYQMPERPVYKSYPVYAPGHEPEGYYEWLAEQEPEKAFDASTLRTEQDWIEAGERVFYAPIMLDALVRVDQLRDPEWHERTGMLKAADGTVPFFSYVIREKGKIQVGQFSCGTCHTRVMPDGSVIKGAPGNVPLNRLDALDSQGFAEQVGAEKFVQMFAPRFRALYGSPWLPAYTQESWTELTVDDIVGMYDAIPSGVQPRFSTSLRYPAVVPDLIGIKDRRFFDRTGHSQHRDAADLMRYAATQQDVGLYARYRDWIPLGGLPDPEKGPLRSRYSEEQLYALALYLYSLEPPPNPNPFDEKAKRGKAIFDSGACPHCHEPPLYTNNKLTPVQGFEVPADHPMAEHIEAFSVGTDPGLALISRRGTGFYKVPSLKGVWYRGPFEHSGSVATLEDWFDPGRLRHEYVPTGFKGYGVKTRAVRGHSFGLDLSPEDREALIAFLRTL